MLSGPVFILGFEALLVSLLLLGLFHGRRRWGYGPLFISVGTFQYLQVVLARTVYVDLGPIGQVSPGSMVLFSSSLMVVLLVYVRSGVRTTQRLIFGLAIANSVMVVLSCTAMLHLGTPPSGAEPGVGDWFFRQNSKVLAVGTACLVLDVVFIVVVYEALSFRVLGSWVRIFLSILAALIVDQLLFVTGAFWTEPDYFERLTSGLGAKGVSTMFYSTALWAYLRLCPEQQTSLAADPTGRVFGILSYRQRYELLGKSYADLEVQGKKTQIALAETHENLKAEATQRLGTELTLMEREERLAVVSGQLITAQEDERRAVAQELHDELGQLLTALKLELGMKKSTPVARAASDKRAVKMLDAAVGQVRSLSLRLRPALLDDRGLQPALSAIIGILQHSASVQIDLEYHLGAVRLSRRLETVLYRVAQESMTNIIRHSGATQASVALTRDGEFVRLRVKDNGCGFVPDDVVAHLTRGTSLGLTGMSERVEMVGGELSIVPRPGKGTTIEARCPYEAQEETAPLPPGGPLANRND